MNAKSILKCVNKILSQIVNSIRSVLCVLIFSSFRVHKHLNKIKNTTNGNKICYILGNGPSLKEVFRSGNLPFQGEDTLVVNLFYKSEHFLVLKPKYYFIIDSSFVSKENNDAVRGIKEDMVNQLMRVDWMMFFLIPHETDEKFANRISANKNIQILKFNKTPVSGLRNLSFYLYRRNLGMPLPANVLNGAVFLMLNLGYKNIFLYGADFSWMKDLVVDEKNQVCCFQNHLYDNKRELYVMPKDSLKNGLQGIVDALNSFSVLNIYATQCLNAKIINRTKGSFVDVFDSVIDTLV